MSGLAGARPQHRPLASFIYQEQPHIVEIKALTNEIHRGGQQSIRIEDRGSGVSNLCGSLQLDGKATQCALKRGTNALLFSQHDGPTGYYVSLQQCARVSIRAEKGILPGLAFQMSVAEASQRCAHP